MFISKEEINNRIRQAENSQRVTQLKLNKQLRDTANPENKDEKFMKYMYPTKQPKPEPPPKPITVKEVKNHIQVQKLVSKTHEKRIKDTMKKQRHHRVQ